MENLTITFKQNGSVWTLEDFTTFDASEQKSFSSCIVRRNGNWYDLLFAPCKALGDTEDHPIPNRSRRGDLDLMDVAKKFPLSALNTLLQ